ncbi:MAG: ThiF family adenylyltransferase [Betaproteobacteria bacterium]
MTVQDPEAEPADLARRFGGMQRLFGIGPAARIRAARVAVVGVGGVGSWCAEALARSGVGHLTLIDLDHVAESNINRQVHALQGTIGQAKVQAMRERIAQINPECVVTGIEQFVDADNWPALMPDPVDALIDACDQVHAKAVMAAWAMLHRETAFITVGAAGGKRLAHRVDIDDLSQATHDPLLARLRTLLRKQHRAAASGRRIGVDCVFSPEPVQPADPSCAITSTDGTLNCHGYGSMVSVTATFGQCAAGWVLNRIADLR